MVGRMIGMTTVRNVRHGLAPRVWAASVTDRSSRESCGYSVSTQYGKAM
jgi:hypothetical protein